MYFTCVSNSENIIHSTWSNRDNHSVHFQQYIFEHCVVSLKPQWNETNFLISSNKNILSNVERLRLSVSAFSWPAFLSFIIESIYVCIIQQRQRSRDSKVSQIRRRNGTSVRSVFPTRERKRERESSRRYRSPSFSTFSANLWRYYRAVVDVVAPLGSTVPPFPAVSSFLQTGLAVWYRSTVEAHELFSRLCPWENTRVAPVGIVNAAANCARRRRPLAWILNIAFFRHRYRPFPSPNPQPLYRTLSASVSDSANHLHPAVFLFLLCSSINREIFSFHYGWLDGLVPTAIFREQTLAGRSPLPQDLAFELFPA